jgi:hypothetical protein
MEALERWICGLVSVTASNHVFEFAESVGTVSMFGVDWGSLIDLAMRVLLERAF